MPELTMELTVGDVVVIGDRTLTVVEIEDGEVSFRLDPIAGGVTADGRLLEYSADETKPPRRAK